VTAVPVALITGVSGQDGQILADRLLAEGVEVHGLLRSPDDAVTLRPGVVPHTGDLTDHARVAAVVRQVAPDQIYNLAGVSSVAFSWQHPVVTGAVSGLGAVAVFEAAYRLQESRGRAVRVLQASSAEVFGLPDRTPQDEGTSLRPVNPYGAAKAYAHTMAGVYRARGLPVSACVLYNHESPLRPDAFVTRKITRAAARIAVTGEGTLVLGNLDARRDWGWAPDYVDAMIRTVRHDVASDFVIATGRTHSVADFAATALRHAGVTDWERRVRVDPALARPVDAVELVGDPRKARDELGWEATVPFEEVVTRMVDHDIALLRAAS
jgi:GDPmannose 4,6-dehydratase